MIIDQLVRTVHLLQRSYLEYWIQTDLQWEEGKIIEATPIYTSRMDLEEWLALCGVEIVTQ